MLFDIFYTWLGYTDYLQYYSDKLWVQIITIGGLIANLGTIAVVSVIAAFLAIMILVLFAMGGTGEQATFEDTLKVWGIFTFILSVPSLSLMISQITHVVYMFEY